MDGSGQSEHMDYLGCPHGLEASIFSWSWPYEALSKPRDASWRSGKCHERWCTLLVMSQAREWQWQFDIDQSPFQSILWGRHDQSLNGFRIRIASDQPWVHLATLTSPTWTDALQGKSTSWPHWGPNPKNIQKQSWSILVFPRHFLSFLAGSEILEIHCSNQSWIAGESPSLRSHLHTFTSYIFMGGVLK